MIISIELNDSQFNILQKISGNMSYETKLEQIVIEYLNNYSDDIQKAQPFDRSKLGF